MSEDLEADLLGLILDDPSNYANISRDLFPELFTGERFWVAQGIIGLVKEGKHPDVPSVAHFMEQESKSRFKEMGGREFLLSLQLEIPYSNVDINQYVNSLYDLYQYRELAQVGKELDHMGKSRYGDEPDDAIIAAQERLLKIRNLSEEDAGHVRVDEALQTGAEILLERTVSEGKITGVPTGFRELDAMIMGLQKSDVAVIAARPAMGKTALALNIAYHAAVVERTPTMFFSLEMNTQDLVERLVSSVTMVPFHRLRKGLLSENEWAKYSEVVNNISDAPFYIDDNSVTSPSDIRSYASKMVVEYGHVGLILVDYISLMTDPTGKHSDESRRQEIAQISRSLKVIARDFNCPVVALSQLNRGLENRPNKRPQLSDLMESSAIEADAGTVSFLYRDEYYYPDTADQGIVELIVAKNRHGDKGTIRLGFMGDFVRFVNVA